ncbi:MAG: hypothetical protein H6742_18185 [Alphaproteobacteria bacterium]|nr:hypothetical protein [Alphaproteobacteria bacterium]
MTSSLTPRWRLLGLARALTLAPLLWLAAPLPWLAAPVAHAEPAARGQVVQELLPALDARTASANAREADALRYFGGQLPLEEAFPELAGAPLMRPAFLQAELRRLDAAEVARAAERLAERPAVDDARLAARLDLSLGRALDAEAAADATRRRLVGALLAGLDKAPDLREAATAPLIAKWRALQLAAVVPDPPAPAAGDPPPADASPGDGAEAPTTDGTAEPAGTAPPAASPSAPEPAAPPAAAVVDAAAAARAEAALGAWLRAARRAITVPGDPTLADTVAADLEPPAEIDSVAGRAWLDRLERVRPLLVGEQAAQVDALLARQEARQAVAELARTRAAVDAARAEVGTPVADPPDEARATATVERLDAELAGLPAPTVAAEGEALSVSDQLTAARHALATARLERAREVQAAAQAAASSGAELDEARRKAEEAAARAAAAKSSEEAAAREVIAQLQAEVADRLAAERSRHVTVAGELQALVDEYDQAKADADAALELPSLSIERGGRIDAAFLRFRKLVRQSRSQVGLRQKHLHTIRAEHAALQERLPAPADLPEDVREAVAVELADVEADLAVVLAQGEDHAEQELAWALQLLSVAKEQRRRVRPQTSVRATEEVRANFMDELLIEAQEAPIIVEDDLRRTWEQVQELPRRITDLNAVIDFLVRSVELVLLAGLWLALRRNGEVQARRLLELVGREGASRRSSAQRLAAAGWFVEGDPRALARPLAPVLFGVADVAVAYVLFRFTRGPVTPLALLVLVWLGRSMFRLGPAVIDLIATTPDDDRPALRVVSVDTAARLKRSVRAVILSVFALRTLHFIALDLFEADRMADLVALVGIPVYGVLVLWLLHTWAEPIRQAILATGEQDALAVRLVKADRSIVFRMVRAAGGLGWLAWRGSAEALIKVAEGRPGLGWLASALARARLNNAPQEDARPLPDHTLGLLRATDAPVPRPEQHDALVAALSEWGAERRRGMVAVIGHRGAGKTRFLGEIEAIAAEALPDVPVVRLELPSRMHEVGPALRWLARATGCRPPSTDAKLDDASIDRLVEELSAQTAKVYVVEDLHRLVLRAVGGFSGIRAVLRVMQAAGEEHMWVCSFHRPTWDYLTGVGGQVNLEAFRARILLNGLQGPELSDWVHARVQAGGYGLRFDPLVNAGPLAGDQGRARERAEHAYWRLLSDASLGIPPVAWGYFCSGLAASPVPKSADVGMFVGPPGEQIESLPDLDLFVLTAIVMHDDLDSASIGAVLNAPVGQVQEACRHLDALAILDQRDDGSWTILDRWRPAVHRVLRQKHFLYMR